jgi:hypothetical protein
MAHDKSMMPSGLMNRSLKMSNNTEFQVGDRVEFTENYSSRAKLGEQGTVVWFDDEFVGLDLDNGSGEVICCYHWRVKHVEATPVPKEFRFFRRSDAAISTDPYESFEEALAAWKAFAQDGQEVEIIEVVSHGSYKAVLKIEEA